MSLPRRSSKFPPKTLLALIAALALLAAACNGGGEAIEGEGLAEDDTEPTDEGIDVGEDDGTDSDADPDGAPAEDVPAGTFVAAIGQQPDQLDPHLTSAYASFQVLENVYDTLVVPNAETLEMEASLATDWEVSDDNLTWTFTLEEGVVFHDGSDFTSADVVYSYERIINEGANNFRFANVESVEAPDEQTVVINLAEPTPNLLANIGGFKGMAIISEGAAEEFDLATQANGTGPFQLVNLSADGVLIEAFADHWAGAPGVDAVQFRFISEPTTALTELQTGGVNWTDNIPSQQIESLSESDDLVLETVPSSDYWYWTANFNVEPFGDPQVRQALAFAIDREAITQAATFGAGTANQTAIPDSSFWFTDYSPYDYDPERAMELLEDAGVEGLQMNLMVTDEFPETVTAAEVIAANLADVGITVEIQTETFGTWLDRQGEGDFDSLFLGWLGNIDPFDFYHGQHLSTGGFNAQGYVNEEVDDLLIRASTTTDEDERKSLYDEAVEMIVDDGSYWFLYNPDVVQAWSPDVDGYQIRADRAIDFSTVSLG
ncbi:ABC transporter substrate-binding protein [soil metagenome]